MSETAAELTSRQKSAKLPNKVSRTKATSQPKLKIGEQACLSEDAPKVEGVQKKGINRMDQENPNVKKDRAVKSPRKARAKRLENITRKAKKATAAKRIYHELHSNGEVLEATRAHHYFNMPQEEGKMLVENG